MRDILRRYCNVEAPEALGSLKQMLTRPESAQRAALFRDQLERTIQEARITPEEYEALTGEDFDSQQELLAWLRQLWGQLYGPQA
jgi:hypothetical protein